MGYVEPLSSILPAIAEQRSLAAVLKTIVETVARQPGVALARVWLRESDDACSVCSPTDATPEVALHLRASAGASRSTVSEWMNVTGAFHRIPLFGGLKIAQIAANGESIRVQNLVEDNEWIRFREWARTEGLVSFAGHALKFRGEILGVLAVFRRAEADDKCFAWLGTMASAAAIAIANAKAFDENESLRIRIEQERDYLREEVQATGSFGEILGGSPGLERVWRQVEMAAATGANVLISGESGTGKELIARAIHQRSERSQRPLVKVNCGSIPRELFESEFFGHMRGSFAGATRDRLGRFQLADQGTLLLDEVGEIPLELQAKLLRVLQEGKFERVGEETTRKVNVRLIAATNRDLKKDVEEGRFRLDLYYRLGVFPIEVPPLRDRVEDIPALLAHFARQAVQRFHVPAVAIPNREVERAMRYAWPGNVRELQNVVERAVIVSSGGKLLLDLPQGGTRRPQRNQVDASLGTAQEQVISEKEWRERERQNILAALRQTRFRISGKGGAANLLGVNPATLTSRLKVLGINKRDYQLR